jgi:hypothetical protein
MKTILALVAFCSIAAAQPDFGLRLEGERLDLQATNGQRISLQVAALLYRQADGALAPANERYVVQLPDGASPKIIDILDGHSVKLQFAELDEEKGYEVLAFYFSGGNQYAVNIYRVEGVNVRPLRTQPASSNMRSVQATGKDIVVKNQGYDADGAPFITTDTYRVVKGDCKRVREEKTAERAAGTNGSSAKAGKKGAPH